MTPFLVLCGLLLAASPPPPPTWAGVPLDALAGLGLGPPTVDPEGDHWRATVAGEGLIELFRFPDADAAAAAFEALRHTGSTRTPALTSPYSAGDATYLIEQVGNIVLRVRAPRGDAVAWSSLLRTRLVKACPEGTWTVRRLDGTSVTLDACGRPPG